MAWKLKKSKGLEADEEPAPEQTLETPAQAAPSNFGIEPDRFAPPLEAAPGAPSVISLGPPDPVFEPPAAAAQEPAVVETDAGPGDMHRAVHDLSEPDDLLQPVDMLAQQELPPAGAGSADYFAASAANVHGTDFDLLEEDGPAQRPAFDLDMPETPAAHAAPSPPGPQDHDFLTGTPAAQDTAPQSADDSLDAFAPYKPAAAPPPERDRFFAVDEPAGSSYSPIEPVQDAGPSALDAGADANGSGMRSQSLGLPQFEEELSFAPVAASRLIVKIGPFTANYEVNKAEITVGRPDVKTNTNPDIGLEWDDAVSRHHARILRRSDGDYLEDVGSSNGTLLNGQRVAVDTPVLLKDGDIITIGERTQITYFH